MYGALHVFVPRAAEHVTQKGELAELVGRHRDLGRPTWNNRPGQLARSSIASSLVDVDADDGIAQLCRPPDAIPQVSRIYSPIGRNNAKHG